MKKKLQGGIKVKNILFFVKDIKTDETGWISFDDILSEFELELMNTIKEKGGK